MKCEPDFVPHFGAQVELRDCYRLIRAMAGVENGKDSALYISDSDLWEGYRLAFPQEVSHFLAENDTDEAPEVAPSVNKKYFFNYDIKDGNGKFLLNRENVHSLPTRWGVLTRKRSRALSAALLKDRWLHGTRVLVCHSWRLLRGSIR